MYLSSQEIGLSRVSGQGKDLENRWAGPRILYEELANPQRWPGVLHFLRRHLALFYHCQIVSRSTRSVFVSLVSRVEKTQICQILFCPLEDSIFTSTSVLHPYLYLCLCLTDFTYICIYFNLYVPSKIVLEAEVYVCVSDRALIFPVSGFPSLMAIKSKSGV